MNKNNFLNVPQSLYQLAKATFSSPDESEIQMFFMIETFLKAVNF